MTREQADDSAGKMTKIDSLPPDEALQQKH